MADADGGMSSSSSSISSSPLEVAGGGCRGVLALGAGAGGGACNAGGAGGVVTTAGMGTVVEVLSSVGMRMVTVSLVNLILRLTLTEFFSGQ